MKAEWVRRLAGGLAALTGAALILAGLLVQRVDLMVLGLAGLLVVLAGLFVSLRFRLGTLSAQVVSHSQAMQALVAARLVEINRTSTQSNGLVLRSFRDMGQALDSLSTGKGGLWRGSPSPLCGDGVGWDADPETLLAVGEQVKARKPGLVVECGSGTSTVWLAKALCTTCSGPLVALEHVEHLATQTRALLDAYGPGESVEIRLIPPSASNDGDGAPGCHQATCMGGLVDISMLIVDRPPGSPAAAARNQALRGFQDRLAPGALVLIDCAGCEPGEVVVGLWQPELGGYVNPRMISARMMAVDYLPGVSGHG